MYTDRDADEDTDRETDRDKDKDTDWDTDREKTRYLTCKWCFPFLDSTFSPSLSPSINQLTNLSMTINK